jgi:plastocyanin
MKLKLLFLSAFSMMALAASATKLTITVQDFKFTPADASINLGDTVLFTWINGSHTTTSRTIPSGAAAWDHPMNNGSTSFQYVPTVAGVYNYVCVPHESMGHIGKFTVNGGTNISNYELGKVALDVYPNPAATKLNIIFKETKKAFTVAVTDITGKIVIASRAAGAEGISLDISQLSEGMYITRIEQDGKTLLRKFTVAR